MNELIDLRQQVIELEALKAEQRQVEEALRESQAYITGIIDIASEAIISVDETLRIILFNQGAERIFGYSKDEAVGQPLDILLPETVAAIHRHHVVNFADSADTARLMGERQEISGRRKGGQEFPVEASISKLEVNGKRIFTVFLRDITERKHQEAEREKLIGELKALNEAAQTITSELALKEVLHKIVESARFLIKAKYAALAVRDDHGNISNFVTAGLSQEDHARIGSLPTGRGLLGVLLHQGKPMIVKDVASHPAAVGVPKHHPVMQSLLGVPIYSKETLIGAIYLTDKEDGSDFSKTDQELIEMLALHAAIAIENARLYEQTQRLAILEERERFARDLHDGIIQSIYGVGLSLDNAKAAIRITNQAAREQIDLSLKSLSQVITDVRNYIFDLRPQALKDKGLNARLQGLVKELEINTLLLIEADIDPEINTYLNDTQASHIFHITHEALANVVRHAQARKVHLSLTKNGDTINLLVEDDGIGFKPPARVAHGHHGMANIYKRVSLLGATLNLDSVPAQGTRLAVTLDL